MCNKASGHPITKMKVQGSLLKLKVSLATESLLLKRCNDLAPVCSFLGRSETGLARLVAHVVFLFHEFIVISFSEFLNFDSHTRN